jgi:phosphoribosylformimino-5-aminoimidazole carboxamide ribotide isomerase
MRALFERIDAALADRNEPDRHDTDAAACGLATLVPVFGSETLTDIEALHAAQRAGLAPILSLDHRAGDLLAARALDPSPAWWPSRVIAMTLDQVGSYAGPDLATFERLRAQAPAHTTLIGAGGIRHRADLAAAASTGATAWLVASALHDRLIDCAHSGSA